MMENIEVIRSKRRTAAVEVRSGPRVVVRVPLGMRERDIRRFIEEKSEWIEKHILLVQQREQPSGPVLTEEEIAVLKAAAREDISRRAESWAGKLGVDFGRITIRCQRGRWGSCSSKGDLNFNCLLMLCPPEVRDYVVVHELCHRLELNHSPRFWDAVERALPEYPALKRWLKENGSGIIGRLRA